MSPFQPGHEESHEVSAITSRFIPLQHRNKINRAGELIVNSEESRYQMRNLAICLEKIRTMVTEATETPKVVSKETTQKLIERYLHWNGLYLRWIQITFHDLVCSLFKKNHLHTHMDFLFLKEINHWSVRASLLSWVASQEQGLFLFSVDICQLVESPL